MNVVLPRPGSRELTKAIPRATTWMRELAKGKSQSGEIGLELYLTEPVSLDPFLQRVESALGGRRVPSASSLAALFKRCQDILIDKENLSHIVPIRPVYCAVVLLYQRAAGSRDLRNMGGVKGDVCGVEFGHDFTEGAPDEVLLKFVASLFAYEFLRNRLPSLSRERRPFVWA